MPTPDQTHVATLLNTADNVVGMARVLLQNAPHYYEGIGFHCQQAVEKYPKAVLITAGLPAPFIHNLVVPMGPLQQHGFVSFTTQDLTNAAVLNEFAVELRYELDDAPDYTSADLLDMAQQFQLTLRPLAQSFLI